MIWCVQTNSFLIQRCPNCKSNAYDEIIKRDMLGNPIHDWRKQ